MKWNNQMFSNQSWME